MLFLQDFESNSHLVERWGHQQSKFKSTAIQQPVRANIPANPAIRKYVFSSQTPISTTSWLSKREIPTSAEILGTPQGNGVNNNDMWIPVNEIQGPWPSKEDYLCAHYELLREDAVAPLRDAVAKVRAHPKTDDSDDTCVYESVCCRFTVYLLLLTITEGLHCRGYVL